LEYFPDSVELLYQAAILSGKAGDQRGRQEYLRRIGGLAGQDPVIQSSLEKISSE